ncbi:MAG: hypothetical protein C7B43_04795 [Sulfobacillus benefaciens]|uniref:MIP18 family-like domain-containing protein n=1 Tax=Sulfobacillus benefaciens TaxID=453960 RepID=A0A2T2X8H1_9FIRM|nr:MAG: hypothetical protein C7B43_04795 [Sulfobacillus benefaciens]
MYTQEARIKEIWHVLDHVYDPELDRSIHELNFVACLEVSDTDVAVTLRLPTYWCSPNFSFMMMKDLDDALMALPWVKSARITLIDHESQEKLNQGIARHQSFSQIFSESTGDLESVRRVFKEKAFYSRQKRVLDYLQTQGLNMSSWTPGTWQEVRQILQAPAPGQQLLERYEEMAQYWKVGCGDNDAVIVDISGRAISPELWGRHSHILRLVALNMESNAHICQGLLAVRYPRQDPGYSLPLVDSH